jgi:hypothetical protein
MGLRDVTALIALLVQSAPVLLGVLSAGGAWLWVRRSGRRDERADMQMRASRAAERAREVREQPMSRRATIERLRRRAF